MSCAIYHPDPSNPLRPGGLKMCFRFQDGGGPFTLRYLMKDGNPGKYLYLVQDQVGQWYLFDIRETLDWEKWGSWYERIWQQRQKHPASFMLRAVVWQLMQLTFEHLDDGSRRQAIEKLMKT